MSTQTANPETAEAVTDGTTVYVMPDPAGLGATLERAVSVADRAPRHVVVCGPRPGAGKSGAMAWASEQGAWFQTRAPHITRSSFRGGYARDGITVHVSRVEPWFGDVLPGDAADAMRVLRHVCAKVDVRPTGTPGQTGRRMLEQMWSRSGASFPECPAPVAELLRDTSGQGRFQLFARPDDAGAVLVGVDARFQYGALAQLELPTGVPFETTDPDPYAPQWCEIEFEPVDVAGVGLLPVKGLGGWHYPIDGGPHRTWASGAEIHLAREHGYRITVRRAIVWPNKSRTLAPFARLLATQRDRIESLPLPEGVRSAARSGLRAILVQTVGALHGRNGASSVCVASATQTEGASFVPRPEWSTAIYGLARSRLAGQMIAQTAPVVACALDGFYVAGEPVVPADDGAAGRWREVGRWGAWSNLRTLADVYAVRESEPVPSPEPVEPEPVRSGPRTCRLCDRPVFGADVHPCCEMNDHAKPCPACEASAGRRRQMGESVATDPRRWSA